MARRSKAGPPRPERVAAFGLGLSAESRAAAYLVAKGYRIAARRFRTPFGEVDIVARRGRVLVFVEVKARSTLDAAAEALRVRQQRRIADAAAFWLSLNPHDAGSDIRFDAMLVAPGKIPRHIQAAFETE
ncbi:MAG: YraN family protein [Xanthobacteraceae bacterium]|nr:YraN family protein [Xanthobacteraceae bacterium]